MERVSLLQQKLKIKLRRELILHFFGSIFFLCLAAFEAIPIINRTKFSEWSIGNSDREKLYVLAFGVAYINVFTSAVLCLKHEGLKNVNTIDVHKCRMWVYLEILNIFLLTSFLLIACRFLFPPPFHNMTGVPLLFLVYWLPLVVYKTSQIQRMRQLIRLFNNLPLNYDYDMLMV